MFALNTDEGASKQLTDGDWDDNNAAVSPDGRELAFLRTGSGVSIVEFEGTHHVRTIAEGNRRPSWSRDGTGVWCGTPFALRDPNDGHVLRSFSPPDGADPWTAQELTDGSLIFISRGAGHRAGVVAVAPGGGYRWLFEGDIADVLSVTPDQRHVLISVVHNQGSHELYDLPLDGSPPNSLMSSEVAPAEGVGFSPNGKRVVWSDSQARMGIYAVGEAGRLLPLEPDVAWETSWTSAIPGTSRLITISKRSGARQAWIIDTEGRELTRVVPSGDMIPRSVEVSPDGQWLLFRMTGKGLYAGPLSGEAPLRRLTENETDWAASFTHDGKSVIYSAIVAGGNSQIWSVPTGGGAAYALLGLGTSFARASPIDDRLVYSIKTDKGDVPRVRDLATGRDTLLSKDLAPGDYIWPQFTPDGRHVLLDRNYTDLIEVELETGRIVRTVSARGGQFESISFTKNGMFVLWDRFVGDIWMADLDE